MARVKVKIIIIRRIFELFTKLRSEKLIFLYNTVAIVFHILCKDTVAACRIVHKYMCYRTHERAVLDNRAPAHSLHYTACRRKQTAVGYSYDNILGDLCIIIAYIRYFRIKKLRMSTAYGSADLRFSAVHLLP